MGTLDGQVALISGAARGQGRSHALRLAEDGADVIAVDVPAEMTSLRYPLATADDLAETVRLVEERGRRALAVHADVRDAGAVAKGVGAALEETGRVDIVCANAGILAHGPSWEITDAQWNETIDTNLTGAWNTIKTALPAMREARRGCIVITSSMVGLRAVANAMPYVASKFALVGMTRSLAIELGPFNIRVNAVHPTTVDTTMVRNEAGAKLFRPDLEAPRLEDCEDVYLGLQTLPVPWIQPGDVSAAIAWLVSDSARNVTGISLPIDAGASIK